MGTFSDLVTSLTVVFGLLSVCLAGYITALMDFRPKEAKPGEEPHEEMEAAVPETTARGLSLSELGIFKLGDMSPLDAEGQRRLKMAEHVRIYSQRNPEDVAGVIRSWLSG
jgi:flagellar biosynthesis/type III secretory pathway M-ring protein FliF/YscJ